MDMDTVDKLLTTTRSVRKRLDFSRPVEPEVIRDCLEIAIQAPSGSNAQGWRFMVVTDADKRAGIAAYYKRSFDAYSKTAHAAPVDPQRQRGRDSAVYLSEHMQDVPVLIIPCIEGRPESRSPEGLAGLYGSILPAAWSLMLALRARGLGSAWTTLHLNYEQEVAAILGIPDNFTQVALLPVAYFTGDDFHPAKRRPASEITYWDAWGTRDNGKP